MLIKKIISGGQTGADRAVLDFAIEAGIPYGGWIPKGRKAEDGSTPERYDQLQEMATDDYAASTDKNILDSHGTLIISHGELTGGPLRASKIAEQNKRPCLHIDLFRTTALVAAGEIISWISGYEIEILHVTGPKASKGPMIYEGTLEVLKAFHDMATGKDQAVTPPRTVGEAVDRVIAGMTLHDKTKLARMNEEDLIYLHPELGAWIRDKFELLVGNHALMNSCLQAAGTDLDADSASFLIIKILWERLKSNYSLRMVVNKNE